MLKSGHRVLPVFAEECQAQYELFHGNRVGTIRLDPDRWFFTLPFIEEADKIFDFKFKPSDTVIMTYPKCGTTWTQEIVWTILNNPNLDNPKAILQVNIRCPFLELDFLLKGFPQNLFMPGNMFYDMFKAMHPERKPEDGIFRQLAEITDDPRIVKTHLPFSLLKPSLLDTCKVIYVARNPKDVAVSYCHHQRLIKGHDFKGNLSEFVDHFVNDTLLYSPFWTHYKEAWELRNHSNLLYIFYEDLKAEPKKEITKIQEFLGAKLTEDQIDNIVNYTSFNVMKNREKQSLGLTEDLSGIMFNEDVQKQDGGFFRKGATGDWKSKLTVEDVEKIDKWTEENAQEFDGDFKYKIK